MKPAHIISVCKQVIGRNNKRGWTNPEPAIRVGRTPSGPAVAKAHRLGIKDAEGNIVAEIVSTQDGNPVIKAGAKVAILAQYETVILE